MAVRFAHGVVLSPHEAYKAIQYAHRDKFGARKTQVKQKKRRRDRTDGLFGYFRPHSTMSDVKEVVDLPLLSEGDAALRPAAAVDASSAIQSEIHDMVEVIDMATRLKQGEDVREEERGMTAAMQTCAKWEWGPCNRTSACYRSSYLLHCLPQEWTKGNLLKEIAVNLALNDRLTAYVSRLITKVMEKPEDTLQRLVGNDAWRQLADAPHETRQTLVRQHLATMLTGLSERHKLNPRRVVGLLRLLVAYFLLLMPYAGVKVTQGLLANKYIAAFTVLMGKLFKVFRIVFMGALGVIFAGMGIPALEAYIAGTVGASSSTGVIGTVASWLFSGTIGAVSLQSITVTATILLFAILCWVSVRTLASALSSIGRRLSLSLTLETLRSDVVGDAEHWDLKDSELGTKVSELPD